MFYLFAIIGIVLACCLTATGGVLARRIIKGSGGSEKNAKLKEIDQITKKLNGLDKYIEAYASPGQLSFVQQQLAEVTASFAKQQEQLKEIEGSLTTAQKSVEQKETQQQELKTLKEEDENKLNQLIANFDNLNSEAESLEQELALSMKNLEDMLANANLTDYEKDILNQFNEAVISAGGRLRDLMTEYSVVKERLEGLQQQFQDLESEYTRLVEQQLGV